MFVKDLDVPIKRVFLYAILIKHHMHMDITVIFCSTCKCICCKNNLTILIDYQAILLVFVMYDI